MPTHELKRRRGTTEEHKHFRGAVGELTVDTDKNTVVVHDGITYGGHPLVTQRDLFEFLGKDYFINVEDLSDNLKRKLDETIDIDYINSIYRRLDTKLSYDDMEDEVSENIQKIVKMEEEFISFLECIQSSELSTKDKKMGADIVGYCVTNNRFSRNVLTVQDALDELVVRIYNEEYNTSKLNSLISSFSSSLENYKTRLESYDGKFLLYSDELNCFIQDSFNPIKDDIYLNSNRISNLENNVYNKSQVDDKIAETFNTTGNMLEALELLTKFFQDETNVESVILNLYSQVNDELKITQNNVTDIQNNMTNISKKLDKNIPIYGSSQFNSTKGVVINHYLNTLNYNVSITPTSNPNGKLGEIWVEKNRKYCTVYCSGSTTETTFDYLITESDRIQ